MAAASPPTSCEVPMSLSHFTVSIQNYLNTASPPLHGVVVSALIFHPIKSRLVNGDSVAHPENEAQDRVLLVRRSATDGCPNLWEPPGGGAEPGLDNSPLQAVHREVYEETGLKVVRVRRLVEDGTEWLARGQPWRKLSFEVEVEENAMGSESGGDLFNVVLNPAEHQDYAWVTREELVRGMTRDGRELKITFDTQTEILLKGFELREQSGGT